MQGNGEGGLRGIIKEELAQLEQDARGGMLEVKEGAVFSACLVGGTRKAGGESFGGRMLTQSSVWHVEYELIASSPGKDVLMTI